MELVAAALIGLALGSFATVLIVRIPANQDWVRERSACPQCGLPIRWFDNVPVVSWIMLRGRCRSCGKRIPRLYPMVELVTAIGCVGVVLLFGVRPLSAGLAVLWMVSVAWIVIDLKVRRLPDAVSIIAVIAVIVSIATEGIMGGYPHTPLGALWGVLILGGVYFLLWFIYPPGMGLGDVKAASILGAVLGYLGWSSLAVGAILGPLVGGIPVIVGLVSGRLTRKSAVPYGPALVVGAWLGILAGDPIAHQYVVWVTGG